MNTDKLCMPPEVCGPDAEGSKREHLLSQTTNDTNGRVASFIKRDKPLLVSIVVMLLLMNIPMVGLVLYPFKIFSTWIHELSHGMAAIIVGGGISKLLIYPDTSGLAYTFTTGSSFERGFVASAGYTGTAVLGMILLLFRRTHRGPTTGTIGIGALIILSCLLYVRNLFALMYLPTFAIIIIICAWKLKAKFVGYLYSFLAATIAFNSIDNISELFGGQGYVNGEPSENDANAVAEHWGGTTIMWASIWFVFALVCSSVGLLFAFDGLAYKEETRNPTITVDDREADLTNDPELGAAAVTYTGVTANNHEATLEEDYQLDDNVDGLMQRSEVGAAAGKKKKLWSWKK